MDPAWLEHRAAPAARNDDATTGRRLLDLSDWGLLAISGAERERFLQGQLTCDVALVSTTRSLLGALCSPKGRMLACGRLFAGGETLYWRLPRELLAGTADHLRRYLLRTKARIDNLADEQCGLGLSGPGSAELLAERLGIVPPADVNAAVAAAGGTVLRVPGSAPRYELWGPTAWAIETWNRLATGARIGEAADWRRLEIDAGLAGVYAATADAFIPQMLGLERLDGVSFRKGCYTGQEVVARLQHLGKLKRHLYRASVAGGAQIGATLVGGAGTEVGKIADVTAATDGGQRLLAVISDPGASTTPVLLADGTPLGDLAPVWEQD